MSGGWQVCPELPNWPVSAGVSGGTGTTINTGATANVYTAWTQLLASTSDDIESLLVNFEPSSSNFSNNFNFEIGIGSAGNEVAVVTDFVQPFASICVYEFPISIPAGTRISARVLGDGNGSDSTRISAQGGVGGTFTQGFSGVENVINAPNYFGTNITAGAAGGVMGSYGQIIASTARDYAGIYMAITGGSGTPNPGVAVIDLAVGGSGSEKIIISQYGFLTSITNSPSIWPLFWVPIPAGTRIAVRAGTVAGGTTLRATVFGIF